MHERKSDCVNVTTTSVQAYVRINQIDYTLQIVNGMLVYMSRLSINDKPTENQNEIA